MNDGLNMGKYMLESNDHIIMWINMAPGEFSVRDAAPDFEHGILMTRKFEKLVEIGYLERVGKRRGWYRKRQTSCEKLDFINADESPVDIWLPLRLSDYIQIHKGNETYLIRKKISELEQVLDPGKFVRTHRSYIVNISFIKEIQQVSEKASKIIMIDDSTVRLSAAYRKKLLSRIR